MSDLETAVLARLERRRAEHAARSTFTVDPEIERLGEQLDELRRSGAPEYDSQGLAPARSQVLLYRRRKAAATRPTGDAA